jgi:hypothetical protein
MPDPRSVAHYSQTKSAMSEGGGGGWQKVRFGEACCFLLHIIRERCEGKWYDTGRGGKEMAMWANELEKVELSGGGDYK